MPDYPEAFLQNMRRMLGGEYDAFLTALAKPAEKALRRNPARDFDVPWDAVPWEKYGRYCPEGFRPGRDMAHFAGAYYMQDASAMAPVAALAPRPGENVADICAAPGGKSGQIAAALGGRGCLLSNEYDKKRARMLSGNLERLGVSNALVTNAPVDRLADAFEGRFDAVLADAPCSGEGMFRRDEGARAEWTEGAPEGCRARQAFILTHAARMVRDGGRIVYSTCTFNDIEDEGAVEEFLRACPAFSPEEFSLPGVGDSHGGMLRLWPHKVRGEGHFVALLRKNGGGEAPRAAAIPRMDAASDAAWRMLRDTLPGAWTALCEGRYLRADGDRLTMPPEGFSVNPHLPVLRAGLALCRVGKGYVEPDHALAMALPYGALMREADLSDEEAARFVAGEALPYVGGDGWTRANWHALPLGWGKAVQGTLKNHLPKGLRVSGMQDAEESEDKS